VVDEINTNNNVSQHTHHKGQIVFLDNDIFHLPSLSSTNTKAPGEVVVLGSTLWSHTPKNAAKLIETRLADYSRIFDDTGRLVNIDFLNDIHAKNVEWLKTSIINVTTNFPNKKIMVLTHHLPSFKLVAQKYTTTEECRLLNHGFASSLDDLIQQSNNISYWCCGHTHSSAKAIIEREESKNPCILLVNPKGYPLIEKDQNGIQVYIGYENEKYEPSLGFNV
jgi:hypothetical protein